MSTLKWSFTQCCSSSNACATGNCRLEKVQKRRHDLPHDKIERKMIGLPFWLKKIENSALGDIQANKLFRNKYIAILKNKETQCAGDNFDLSRFGLRICRLLSSLLWCHWKTPYVSLMTEGIRPSNNCLPLIMYPTGSNEMSPPPAIIFHAHHQ